MSDPFPPPTKTTGRTILVATIKALPGKAEGLKTLLAACRKSGESSAEPETHTYRTSRQVDGDSDVFIVIEEYSLPTGLKAHVSGAPFKALAASGLFASLDIKYYEEFDGEGATLHP